MKLEKIRYFLDTSTSIKTMERIEWLLCGTDGTAINDSRCVSIGESALHPITDISVDSWIPTKAILPGFNIDILTTYITEPKIILDFDDLSPTYGQSITIDRPVETSSNSFDYYSQPLLPNYTEISQAQFNDPNFP